MTDFFDDLERELRRAHRRDTARSARSRRFDLRRLSGLPAVSRRTLVALAVIVALVAVVLAVAREADVERQATPPPAQPSPAHGAVPRGGCAISDWWKAPIVDEPIPREITSRFAIFRDPPSSGELPRDLPNFPQAKKRYRSAVTLRRRLDTGTRLRVVVIAADIIPSAEPDQDLCAPPPGSTEPGVCVNAVAPNGTMDEGKCFTIDAIDGADAWFGLTRRTVFGLAPDGVDRLTFDTRATFGRPARTKSLNISENIFVGEFPGDSALNPYDTVTRFAP